jgi:hypothetical protein
MAGAFQVGENTTLDSDRDDPVVVTGIDLTGSIWSTAPTPGGFTSSTPGAPNEATPININLVETEKSVAAAGELMTVRLDVAEDASGAYPMKMHDLFQGNTTQFQNSQGSRGFLLHPRHAHHRARNRARTGLGRPAGPERAHAGPTPPPPQPLNDWILGHLIFVLS